MRKIIIIICSALLSFSAHATIQEPDLIHIEDEVWMLDELSEEEHEFLVDEIQIILRNTPWAGNRFIGPVYPIKEGDSFEININSGGTSYFPKRLL